MVTGADQQARSRVQDLATSSSDRRGVVQAREAPNRRERPV